MDPPNSGRRRAAFRVKQKRRDDQRRWLPSGKLLHRQQTNPIQHRRKPWNDRFIFDEESLEWNGDEAVNGVRTKKRLGSTQKQYAVDGKENNVIEMKMDGTTSAHGNSERCRSTVRHYTERSDGDVVLEFTRCEIAPSSPIVIADGKYPDLIGTRSTGVSPFDMAKVRAALDEEANQGSDPGISEGVWRQSPPSNEPGQSKAIARNNEHNTARSGAELKQEGPLIFPLDENSAKLLLDDFEELLYTMELEEKLLEEELIQRAITMNQTVHQVPGLFGRDNDVYGMNENVPINSNIQANTIESRASLPRVRRDKIAEFAHASKSFSNRQQNQITTNGHLQYHEIIEILADLILDGSIKDVADELEDCVHVFSEHVFEQL